MPSFLALGALFGVAILALFPDAALLPASARVSEKSALIFLFLIFGVAFLPKFQRRLLQNRDAATFLLISAGFVLFHLADRAGPREGWSLRLSVLPDDAFAISYALRLAVLGAILSLPAWIRGGGPQKAIFAALLLIGALGVGTFTFMARFYPVGATEVLDPTPLPTLFLQILGYSSIAALCRAITHSEKTTRLALRLMPLFLLLVWAKLQFVVLPIEAEDAE